MLDAQELSGQRTYPFSEHDNLVGQSFGEVEHD